MKKYVENKVGYHRRNFLVPIPEFDDIRQYNQELLQHCQAICAGTITKPKALPSF